MRGRLWRLANPDIDGHERSWLVRHLMAVSRAVRVARENLDPCAEAALRKRHANCKAANVKVAARIKADLAKDNAILLALVRDVAEAAAEDSRINSELPDDLEPLVPVDFLARGRSPIPRVDIGTSRIWLWTTPAGTIIGDQDAVTDLGDGRGKMGEGRITCD